MSIFNEKESRYGTWTMTSVCCYWEETLTVLNREEAEAGYVLRKKEEMMKKEKMEE